MHLYFFVRGDIRGLDRFLQELTSKYLPFPRQDVIDGKYSGPLVQYQSQVIVRFLPLGMYEATFPEAQLDVILRTLFGPCANGTVPKSVKGLAKSFGAKLLCKAMSLEPMPKKWKDDIFVPCYTDAIEIWGLGIKRDKWILDGKEVDKTTPGAWEAL